MGKGKRMKKKRNYKLLNKWFLLGAGILIVVNVALSIVCEQPKLSPYIDAMKERISALLGIDKSSVGIAVTTNEGVAMHLEDLVTGDAVAAFATVLVRKSL